MNKDTHSHGCCGCSHSHSHSHSHSGIGGYRNELVSLAMLVAGLLAGHFGLFAAAGGRFAEAAWYLLALMPVGAGAARETVRAWMKGDFFNEFSLMVLACAGAFAIGEYPEGVAVLLFYSLGEKLEASASDKARGRIRSLLSGMPDEVRVERDAQTIAGIRPQDLRPGDVMVVRPGERVAADGVCECDTSVLFDNSAITGESVPVATVKGDEVSSGAIAVDREARVRVTRLYADSHMNRIMAMIEEAAAGKSNAETMLRRITRWYTPAVMIASAGMFLTAWFWSVAAGGVFDWRMWLDRSLILLVCSCPCALVVSVPLSYFAAIGNASRLGVLFKGSRYLDALRGADTLLLDKTGTITTGKFHVGGVHATGGFSEGEVLGLAAALDSHSSHPLARAVVEAAGTYAPAVDVVTVAHGIEGRVDGHAVVAGSRMLMAQKSVDMPDIQVAGSSEVCVAVDGVFAGVIWLDDTLRPGVESVVGELHGLGIRHIEILSGDRDEAVRRVAAMAGVDGWRGHMLPADKHEAVNRLRNSGRTVVFVGDGINDAPSLAAADVGIAIGHGGTDVAVESADAVLTGNGLEPLAAVVRLARKVRVVVGINAGVAIGVKLLVMVLGTLGIATLWAAVFADTGITLLTVIMTLMVLRVRKNR